MTGYRATLGIAVVLLAVVAVGTAAMPAAGAVDAADRTAGGQSDVRAGVGEAITGPATANHSAIDAIAAAEDPWRNFTRANQSLANASAELEGIAGRINNNSRYSNSTHNDANQTLQRMDTETQALNRAANESLRAVNNSNATPAQKFMAYRTIESHRRAGEEQSTDAVDTYDDALNDNRATTESTVTVRFAGGLLGGLLIGAALGAIIPFREARNVEEQLKLSRNVTYNRRTALIPIVVGIVLLMAGIGLLYFIGGIDLLGVIL